MSVLRSLIVPGWTKFIPGLVLCIVFAVLTMNVDHLLGRYQKADLASKSLPSLSAQYAELEAAGDAGRSFRCHAKDREARTSVAEGRRLGRR